MADRDTGLNDELDSPLRLTMGETLALHYLLVYGMNKAEDLGQNELAELGESIGDKLRDIEYDGNVYDQFIQTYIHNNRR